MKLLFDTGGAAYALGKLNRECWYLYTFEKGGVQAPDQTLEVSFHLHTFYLAHVKLIKVNSLEIARKE